MLNFIVDRSSIRLLAKIPNAIGSAVTVADRFELIDFLEGLEDSALERYPELIPQVDLQFLATLKDIPPYRYTMVNDYQEEIWEPAISTARVRELAFRAIAKIRQ